MTKSVVVALALIGLSACTHAHSAGIEDHRGNTILRILEDHYVYPERVSEVEGAIRDRSSGLSDLEDRAYASVMRGELSELVRDRHLLLDYSARPLPEQQDEEVATTDGAAQERLESFARRVSYGIPLVTVLDGNVGYIRIDGFLPTNVAGPALEEAIEKLRSTRALVVDLRESDKGGEPKMVALICAYLIPETGRLLTTTTYRDGRKEESRIPAVDIARRYPETAPIYVLTSRKTFSAGEELAYNLKALGRARLIGEPTGGGANPGEVQPVNDNLKLFVPNAEVVSAVTGANWNWTGVTPHEVLPPNEALDRALELLGED